MDNAQRKTALYLQWMVLKKKNCKMTANSEGVKAVPRIYAMSV